MRAADHFGVAAAPEPLPAVCPVSGLAVRARPEWVYTNPGRTYRTTIALIGEAIFWVIPRGYVTEADMAAATDLATAILAEVQPPTPFVFIENFAHTHGGTAGARRMYLHFTNALEGLLGSFPYGMPPFFRLSFNFSRRLHLHRYRVHMVAGYREAVRAALAVLRHHGVFSGNPLPASRRGLTKAGVPEDSGETAPASASSPVSATAVTSCVEDLLAHLGRLDLESPGVPEPPPGGRDRHLQPVYEALMRLKEDMDDFLAEQRALLSALEARHALLLARTASVEARNRELQILLRQSGEDRTAIGRIAVQNVETLLKPLLRLMTRDGNRLLGSDWLARVNADLDELTVNFFPDRELQDYRLTAREIRIARLVRDGIRSKDIAGRLGVSVETVASFRRRLRAKLGVRGQPRNLRTVLMAIRDG